MDDYAKYIDKHPLRYYSLGPSGVGIKNPQPFNTEWVGWFEPGSGFRYLETTRYNLATGYFSPYVGREDAQTFSFTFDSGNRMFFALGDEGQIAVRSVSGASTVDYLFSGINPMMFNNSVLTRNANETYCFYTKTYEQLYYKKASENFSTERLAFSGTSNVKWFTQVANIKPYVYRYTVFGMKENGDGFSLLSKKHLTISSGCNQNFDIHLTGQISYVGSLGAEQYAPSGRFFSSNYGRYQWFAFDNFQNGQISGRIVPKFFDCHDNFDDYLVGSRGTFDTINGGMAGGRTFPNMEFNNINFDLFHNGTLPSFLADLTDVYRGFFFYG